MTGYENSPDYGGPEPSRRSIAGWMVVMIIVSALCAVAVVAWPRPARSMDFCQGPIRITCVVDGDTVWIKGEKIRLLDIDAPESTGGCYAERTIAAAATERLRQLLADGEYRIERDGKDRFGRTLARLYVGNRSVGAILISEGLARPWRGHKEQWCQ